jgi:hypothetical protein
VKRTGPAGYKSTGPGPAPTFHYVRITGGASVCWQVRLDSPAGPLLGTVAEEAGGWRATVVVAGKLHTQPFADRERAAAWLLGLAPKHMRR